MRVGQVLIVGAEKVDTGTVRRMLSVRAGEWFRQDQLYLRQRDLYGLGMFRSVNVVLADTTPPPGDSTVRVVVRVSEAPRHRIRAGAGYGSLDCFRVQSGWTAYDFLGGARSLDLTGQLSKLGVGVPANAGFKQNVCQPLHDDPTSDTANYNATLTLRQPAFLSPRHTASFALFAERRSEFKAYTRQAVGANLAVTFNARRDVPVTVGYSYSVGRTTAEPAVLCERFLLCNESDQAFLLNTRPFGAITISGVRARVNSVLDPSAGSVTQVTLVHASRYVLSDTLYEFNRGELEIAKYYPLSRRSAFAWRIRGGTIVPQPMFPERVRLGLFVDVGQVWERGDTGTTVSGLRVTPGLGLRFITPLGPVRLDAAYNGYPQEPGPLYYLNDTDKSLTATGKTINPTVPSGFWRRVVVQFAVGQAF